MNSSAEAEFVDASDATGQIMWIRYFLQGQGCGRNGSTLYQDNASAQVLAKNRRMSSSQKTQHINIQFFIIKDRIDSGELTVKHCHTGEMIADFLLHHFKVQNSLISEIL